MRWRSYVAVGDSFTEGLDDPYPDGSFRGWADLVAARLAAEAPDGLGYANLAVRGRLFPEVIVEQVPVALAMKPDLISFAAGGNDVLRVLDVNAVIDVTNGHEIALPLGGREMRQAQFRTDGSLLVRVVDGEGYAVILVSAEGKKVTEIAEPAALRDMQMLAVAG